MNECEQAQRLSAYHDGELSGPAKGELEDHLRQCRACAAELNRLRALSRMLAAVAEAPMPPAVSRRLHEAVDALPMADLARMAEICGAIAASILLACSLWILGTQSGSEPRDRLPVWEAVAVAVARQETPPVGPDEQLAQWIVQDLSRKNGHGQD
jgi:anti-sigma factor RsiW